MKLCKIWNKFLILLFFIIFIVPNALSYHLSIFSDPQEGEERTTITRILSTDTRNLNNAPAGILLTQTFAWDPEYKYQDIGHTIRIKITYTATLPSTTDGVWNITVAKETSGLLSNCFVHVRTVNPVGISLDALIVYPNFEWHCLFTQSTKPHFHNHTVWVNRTSLSGTPGTPFSETISVLLETEDVVVIPDMQTPIAEAITDGINTFFWIFLAITSMILYRYKTNPIYAFLGIVVALFSIFWGLLQFTGVFIILIISIGLILIAVGMGKLGSKWRKEEGEWSGSEKE